MITVSQICEMLKLRLEEPDNEGRKYFNNGHNEAVNEISQLPIDEDKVRKLLGVETSEELNNDCVLTKNNIAKAMSEFSIHAKEELDRDKLQEIIKDKLVETIQRKEDDNSTWTRYLYSLSPDCFANLIHQNFSRPAKDTRQPLKEQCEHEWLYVKAFDSNCCFKCGKIIQGEFLDKQIKQSRPSKVKWNRENLAKIIYGNWQFRPGDLGDEVLKTQSDFIANAIIEHQSEIEETI